MEDTKNNIKEAQILRVNNLRLGFEKVLPSSTNYTDSHGILPVFSLRWGRGVLVKFPEGLDAIVGGNNSSHAMLKKSMNNDERTVGTFYWGYDTQTKTLYFEYATDRSFEFKDGKVLRAVIEALKASTTVMRNMEIKL